MKKKIIMIITLLALILMPIVKAETDIDLEAFLTSDGCEPNDELTQTTCNTTDSNGNEISTTYIYDESKNTIRYNTDYSNVKDAVDNSPVLAYISRNLSVAMSEAYTASKSTGVDVDLTVDGGCNLEKTGFCFSGQAALHTMEISMTDRFFGFMIVSRGGTLPANEEDGSKKSVDPTEEVETVQETQEDSNNPQTGSFVEYGIIAILAIALIAVIILKRRSEVEFRI